MKQFEKWQSGDACNVPSDVDCCDMDCHDACKKIKATGWRGALEWFRDKLDYSIEHKELKDIIDEELKGGD